MGFTLIQVFHSLYEMSVCIVTLCPSISRHSWNVNLEVCQIKMASPVLMYECASVQLAKLRRCREADTKAVMSHFPVVTPFKILKTAAHPQ